MSTTVKEKSAERAIDLDRIKERLSKLLALANDKAATEGEATAALNRAHALLAEYNLTLEDAVPADERKSGVTSKSWDYIDFCSWVSTLAMAVSQLYFCKMYSQKIWVINRNNKFRPAHRVYFVGEPMNIELAHSMFEYLRHSAIKLCGKAVKERDPDSPETLHSFRVSFHTGLANRLSNRILKMRLERQDAETVTESGVTLPALRSMYERSLEANKEYLAKNKVKLVSKTVRQPRLSYDGYNKGKAAGDSVSLNRPLTGSQA